jgi:hypothetical protein
MTDLEFDPLDFQATPDPESDKPKNLFQKLTDVQLAIGYIERRGRHPTKRFSFLQISDIRGALLSELASRHILCFPNGETSKQRDVVKESKSGQRTVTQTEVSATFEFVNGDNPSERHTCKWIGWAEGDDVYGSAGAMTHAQRHFYEAFFMLKSGDITVKQYTADEEAELARKRKEGTDRALKEFPGKKVGGPGYTPTKEDLRNSDPSKEPEPEPLDESWRTMPLTMCKLNEHPSYKGKCVGDIPLPKLLQAKEVFVSNVNNRVQSYTSPGHNQLATAFVARLMWEVDQGNVKYVGIVDGKERYEIVDK